MTNVREDENFERILEANPRNLKYIASESDFLVLTVSLNNSTFHMVNAELLSCMKASAYLINIARGSLVDEKALVEALQNHVIAGAGLDTFEVEPLPEDSPLWDMEQVICTPHTTGGSGYGGQAMGVCVCEHQGLPRKWRVREQAQC